MRQQVIQVAYIDSQTINRIIHEIYCSFCATPTNCTWNLQKIVKANLSRLVSHADLSRISPASQPPDF